MDPRPIGVFDSGIGGLMAVRMLRHLLPGEPILYLGDTARMPYGDRPAGEIDRLTGELTGWLLRQNVKALIAACGTISCNAGETLQQLPVPCFDVVTAAAEAAAQATRNGKVGLAATSATIRSGRFTEEIERRTGQAVTAVPCPLLAPMIEHGAGPDDPALAAAVAEYCQPLLQSGVDTVVLGCTHYPLIAELFTRILGPEVTLIDCAGEAAKAAAEAMKEQHLLAEGVVGVQLHKPAAYHLGGLVVTEYRFTALPPQAARQTARRMLGEDFTPRLLPLEKLTAFSTE